MQKKVQQKPKQDTKKKPEQTVVKQITERYGKVIDLERAPGVMIEILREFGPTIRQVLGERGGVADDPPVPPSSIAIAGPGSGSVTMEDLMRLILDMRQEIIKLSTRGVSGR